MMRLEKAWTWGAVDAVEVLVGVKDTISMIAASLDKEEAERRGWDARRCQGGDEDRCQS